MTEEVINETINEDPIADLKKMIQEQQAVILKQNESIQALTKRLNESEKVASAVPAEAKPAVPEKSPQERAWEAMMKELNVKEE